MVELVDCSEESPATNSIQNGVLVLLGSCEHGFKLALLVYETDSLENLANGLLVVTLCEILFRYAELTVVLRKQ